MKKITVIIALLAFLSVFILTSTPVQAQEYVAEDCYEGQEYTEMYYYDHDIKANVRVVVRCLPWWWGPVYLPFGWYLWTPVIPYVAYWDARCYGSTISFTNIHIVDRRFHRFHEHFYRHRHHLRDRFDDRFRHGRIHAEKRYPGLKRPPDFRHDGKRDDLRKPDTPVRPKHQRDIRQPGIRTGHRDVEKRVPREGFAPDTHRQKRQVGPREEIRTPRREIQEPRQITPRHPMEQVKPQMHRAPARAPQPSVSRPTPSPSRPAAKGGAGGKGQQKKSH